MRRKLLFVAGGLGCLALAACGDTQTDLRKAGYDTIQAYNVVGPIAEKYVSGGYPALKVDPTIKSEIKVASAHAIDVLKPLGADLQSNNVLTAVEVSTAEAAVAALQKPVATATQGATP